MFCISTVIPFADEGEAVKSIKQVMSFPSGKDHNLIVLSKEPEANILPSGLMATAVTQPL